MRNYFSLYNSYEKKLLNKKQIIANFKTRNIILILLGFSQIQISCDSSKLEKNDSIVHINLNDSIRTMMIKTPNDSSKSALFSTKLINLKSISQITPKNLLFASIISQTDSGFLYLDKEKKTLFLFNEITDSLEQLKLPLSKEQINSICGFYYHNNSFYIALPPNFIVLISKITKLVKFLPINESFKQVEFTKTYFVILKPVKILEKRMTSDELRSYDYNGNRISSYSAADYYNSVDDESDKTGYLFKGKNDIFFVNKKNQIHKLTSSTSNAILSLENQITGNDITSIINPVINNNFAIFKVGEKGVAKTVLCNLTTKKTAVFENLYIDNKYGFPFEQFFQIDDNKLKCYINISQAKLLQKNLTGYQKKSISSLINYMEKSNKNSLIYEFSITF